MTSFLWAFTTAIVVIGIIGTLIVYFENRKSKNLTKTS